MANILHSIYVAYNKVIIRDFTYYPPLFHNCLGLSANFSIEMRIVSIEMKIKKLFDFQDIAPSGLARAVYSLFMNPVSKARSRFHFLCLARYVCLPHASAIWASTLSPRLFCIIIVR